jgi:hypothetical protein
MAILTIGVVQAAFVHPGCLSTQADLDRMTAKVNAQAQPWKGGWDRLVSNTGGYLDDAPLAQTTINVGGGLSENYIRLAMDCAKAYQCALRYRVSGDTAYGNKAVQIMNAWKNTMTGWAGDTNVSLRAGIYGYEMACAGELMRGYSGWAAADFAAFQTWMVDVFYSINTYFLTYKHGTIDGHYWANWDLANMASMMAIGVLADRQDIFDEGLNYFYSGSGNGNIGNAVHWIHPDGTGQWQESGRDQGHSTMGAPVMATICEIAWNQGIDLYSYAGNKFLAGSEYIAKYNLWYDVAYVGYPSESGHPDDATYYIQTVISSSSRGQERPGWDMIYNHYVNRLGKASPYSKQFADKIRPDGGGFNYGTTSGGFDQLGFSTLTHTLDPIASGTAPSALLPYPEGRKVTLSWAGSAYATGYNVKRGTVSGGPYTTIGTADNKNLYYIDDGLTPGTMYYYVVSANTAGGESADSSQVAVGAQDLMLTGVVIGTAGSWSSKGATKELVFDGSLRNFFDAPDSVSWAGLDLGTNARITGVKYCPRKYFSGRMVGGKFQGSGTADFSSGVVDLYTITSGPTDGVLTPQPISNTNSFRYVRYVSASGGYGNIAEVQFYGIATGSVPAAPVINSIKLKNGFTANLGWSIASGATSYYLKRATTSGGPYTVVAGGNFTGFDNSGLAADTTYYYVVSAANIAGQSADSSEVRIATQSTGPVLVAHYKLEGNINDSSIHGYDATATGTPAYAAGQLGQAIVLDGTDDLVTLPSGVASSQDITVAAWVYWNGGSIWQRIFDFGNNTDQYLFLTPYSGSVMRFAIKNGGSEQAIETTTMTTSQWTHVAVTLEADTAKLYVNGVLKATNTAVTINPSDFNPRVNYIGDSQWSSDPLFSGMMDDFRVYNFALTASQIAATMTGNTAPVFTTDPINNLGAVELEMYTGQSLAGYANDVEGMNTVTFSKDSGPNWLVVTDNGTLSGVPGNSDVGANVFIVRVADTGGLSDTATMNITVANIFSGNQGLDDLLGLASQWMMEGCTDTPACDGADLDGDADVDLDDFAEMAFNWLFSEDLQLHLKLDETSGTTAADSSIYNRPGTLTNDPTWSTEGKSEGALSFDGIDDYVEIIGCKGITGTTSRTCCAWIKTSGASTNTVIMDWGSTAAGQKWLFGIFTSGKLTLYTWAPYIETNMIVTDGQWHHVAAVLDDDGTPDVSEIMLYVDGVLQTVTVSASQAINTASASDVLIGAFDSAGTKAGYFSGLIDAVRIYNRALTNGEITALMQ